MRLSVVGTDRVIRALAELRGPKLRRVVIRSARGAMRPTLADAKGTVPVVTGRLRASLKLFDLARANLKQGEAGVAIYPANDFTFGRGSARRAVARSRRKREWATAKGVTIDKTTPWLYAHIVETGETRKGHNRNAPRWYLRSAIQRNADRMIGDFSTLLGQGLIARKA